MNEVTHILKQIEAGDAGAGEALLPLVYRELRQLAANRMRQERSGHTLQPTALVHEAYLRLVDVEKPQRWDSRGHFFSAAAEAMRRILVERARRRARRKHGGDRRRQDVDLQRVAATPVSEDLLALDESLTRFAEREPRKAELVKLRHFGGLTLAEAAEVLGISRSTADRHWAYARAWLHRDITCADQ